METYTLRGIESMLGISRAVIGGLVASGFVTPSRGKRNEYRFTFQEVVLLRTAYGLRRAHIPARKILRSLKRLRETLPSEVPLSGLRITAIGSEVAVQEGTAQRHVESGQLLFDFAVESDLGSITVLSRESAAPPAMRGDVSAAGPIGHASAPRAFRGEEQDPVARASDPADAGVKAADALDWFRRAGVLEAGSTLEAEAAYRRAISLAPAHADAYLNLGAMLCDSGRCAEAVELFRTALQAAPDEALLHFNLAVALEDLERNDEAVSSYEACLRLEPKLADAHYNVGRLHELSGRRSQAIRHYSEYRRLQRKG